MYVYFSVVDEADYWWSTYEAFYETLSLFSNWSPPLLTLGQQQERPGQPSCQQMRMQGPPLSESFWPWNCHLITS